MTPRWLPLVVGGELSPELRDVMSVASGTYAIRRKSDGAVVYVGESSTGNIRRTMLRHFQAPSTFAAQREVVILGDPAAYEIAVWITSRGHRPLPPIEVPGRRKPNESKRIQDLKRRGVPFTTESDQAALDAQAKWLVRFAGPELLNEDDGRAEHRGQLRMFNPGDPPPVGKLTELGLLTRLGCGGRGYAWSLKAAPVLAYDASGRLFIVYPKKRVLRPSNAAELKEYARTHWGARGRGDVRGGGRAVGPFRALGKGTTIQYTTKKGTDRQLVNYVHEWGEGGPRAFTPPTIVVHDCKGCGPRCGARGALAISGGSYKVNARGIVG